MQTQICVMCLAMKTRSPFHIANATASPVNTNTFASAFSGVGGERFTSALLARSRFAQILLTSGHVHDWIDNHVAFAKDFLVQNPEAGIRFRWQWQAFGLVVNVAFAFVLFECQFRLVGHPTQRKVLHWAVGFRQVLHGRISYEIIVGIAVTIATNSLHFIAILDTRYFNL